MLGCLSRDLSSVSLRVHSHSDRIAFCGSSMICSPSSIALARTTSSSALSSGTLPISLRYMRTGSSMPIMSAAIASSSSAVGSSATAGLSLAGGSSHGVLLALVERDLDAQLGRRAEPVFGLLVSSSLLTRSRSSSRRRLPRSSTLATSCLSPVSIFSALPPAELAVVAAGARCRRWVRTVVFYACGRARGGAS